MKDIVINDIRYQELRLNLQKAGLLDALGGPGPFTLFAPPDEAFNALGAQYYSALQANTNSLTRVLLYHAASSSNRWEDLQVGPPFPTLEGNPVQFSLLNGTKYVNELALTNVDQIADNGVLHQVQGVLIPPSAPAIQLTYEVDPGNFRNTNQLHLTWTGGKGPFMVQRKSDLNASDWVAAATVTSQRSVSFTNDQGNAFFRVSDSVALGAGLRAAFVVPPVTAPGFGEGTFTLVGNRLTYRITYGGLPSPVTGAYIAGPASTNETAPILETLIPDRGTAGQTSGSIPSGSGVWEYTISQALVDALLDGKAYLEFQTQAQTNGALRGQIMPLP